MEKPVDTPAIKTEMTCDYGRSAGQLIRSDTGSAVDIWSNFIVHDVPRQNTLSVFDSPVCIFPIIIYMETLRPDHVVFVPILPEKMRTNPEFWSEKRGVNLQRLAETF